MNYIQEMEWIVENEEAVYTQELIHYMLENIGNVDSYIRDSLIYRTFYLLILKNPISLKIQQDILETCISSNYLFENITEGETDAVFKRSFSALVITLILSKDSKRNVLDKELIGKTITESLTYLMLEKDFRGYVEGKGWAHAIAHGCDLLAACIQHPLFEAYDEALIVLKNLLLTTHPFIDDEHSRMVPVIDSLVEKGVSEGEIIDWLSSLTTETVEDSILQYRMQWNVERFMKELAWYFLKNKKCEEISKWILNKY